MNRGPNAPELKFDEVKGSEVSIDDATLAEISKQSLTPYKAKQVNGWIQDPRFAMPNTVVYRRNNDFVVSSLNDQKANADLLSVNMGDTDPQSTKLAVETVMENIRNKIPNAAVMSTGSSVGANAINAYKAGRSDTAVQDGVKWANNR